MNSLSQICKRIILIVALYAVLYVSLSPIASTQLYLLATLILCITAYASSLSKLITVASTILIIHMGTLLFPDFALNKLTSDFLASQILIFLIAGVASYIFKPRKDSPQAFYAFDTLFEQNNDAVFILSLEGKHIATNQRAVNMMGYDSTDKLNQAGYKDIVHPDEISATENVLARLLAGENIPPYERLFRKKDGTKLPVEVNVQLIRDSFNEPVYVQSIARDITERKQQQEELRFKEMHSRMIFEHSPIAIWEEDLSAAKPYIESWHTDDYPSYFNKHPEAVIECMKHVKITSANQQTLQIIGVQDELSLSKIIFKQASEEVTTYTLVRQQLQLMLEGKTQFQLSGNIFSNNGDPLSIFLDIKIFPGYEETWERILVTLTDITKLKQAEIELTRSHNIIAQFQSYLTHLHHLTVELGKIDSLDDLYKRSVMTAIGDFGFSRAALFIADDDANVLRGTYGTSPEGDIRTEHDYSEPLNQADWFAEVLTSPNRVALWENAELLEYGDTLANGWKAAAALWSGDDILGYIVVDNHLTGSPPRAYELDLLSLFSGQLGNLIARRGRILKLQESQQLLDSTFSSLNDAILFLDEETGFVLDCNDATERMFGYSRDELLGSFPKFADLSTIVDDSTGVYILASLFANTFSNDYFELETKDGKIIYADIHLIPLEAPQKKIGYRWVMVLRDMTDRKKMEQKTVHLAIEQDRVLALQQLITNLTHDVATPLTTIKTSMYIMGKLKDELRRQEKLGSINTQIEVIEATLKSVTEMTRIDILNAGDLGKSSVSLHNFLTKLHEDWQTHAQAKQQTLNLHLPPNPISIELDEPKLYTAVKHILRNAIQYTNADGIIDLSLQPNGVSAIISVQDTGIGISDKDQKHIFERMYRGQEHRPMDGSHGIGLPIAQRIVELHGGRIEVDSKLDQGSTFRIYIPLKQAAEIL